MYASGQHVKRDDLQAYARMKLTQGKLEAMLKARFTLGQPANGLVNCVPYALANNPQKEDTFLNDLVGKIRKEADKGGSAIQKFSYAANTAHMTKKRPKDQVLNQYIVDAAQQG